jgi:hypothetical protein
MKYICTLSNKILTIEEIYDSIYILWFYSD